MAPASTRAYVLRRFGAAGARFETWPLPATGPGQVTVRVHASGLNPVDFKIRDGATRGLGLHRRPVVLGNELSGEVVERHEDARRFDVGARVCLRMPVDTMGAFAGHVVIDENLLSGVPDAVDDHTAAALPLAGLTAWQALHEVGHLQAGQRVFISAGAGGVGTLAIQLATLAGAQVATTASPAGTDLVRRLGADVVVNYRRDDPGDVLDGYDLALDLVGGEQTVAAMRTLRPGGRLVSLAGPAEPTTRFGSRTAGFLVRTVLALRARGVRKAASRYGIDYRYLFMWPDAATLDHLLGLAAGGSLTVPISAVAPAARLPDALDELQQGHVKGKLLVDWLTA